MHNQLQTSKAEIKDVTKEHINGIHTTESRIMRFTKYELITIWPCQFSMSFEWFFSLLTISQPCILLLVNLLVISYSVPQPHQPEDPHNHGKTDVQEIWCRRDLAIPSTPTSRRETGLTLTSYVKTHWMNNNTAYQFTLGWQGSKRSCRCLVIPSGCKQGAHTLERDIS